MMKKLEWNERTSELHNHGPLDAGCFLFHLSDMSRAIIDYVCVVLLRETCPRSVSRPECDTVSESTWHVAVDELGYAFECTP